MQVGKVAVWMFEVWMSGMQLDAGQFNYALNKVIRWGHLLNQPGIS